MVSCGFSVFLFFLNICLCHIEVNLNTFSLTGVFQEDGFAKPNVIGSLCGV